MHFRITPRKDGRVARIYYSEERLAKDSPIAFWGNIDEAFGMDISWTHADNLFKGRHPNTGEDLTRKRLGKRSGWDMTFVAPKTASVLWGLSDPSAREKILREHLLSVDKGLQTLSDQAIYTQIKGNDENGKARTIRVPVLHGGFVFNHGMSRWTDPHLHSHVFLLNLGYLPIQGKWRSISIDYRWSYVAKGIYLLNFAWGLKQLGYRIKKTGKTFVVHGLEPVVSAFTRASDVFSINKVESATAWKEIRKKKDLSKNFDRLRTYWRTRALVNGLDLEQISPSLNNAGTNSDDDQEKFDMAAVRIKNAAARHLAHVWQNVIFEAIGRLSPEDCQTVIDIETERFLHFPLRDKENMRR